ncbi:GntR family transcriptional regulator [Streptomyces sp. NPDC002817]|uniref:GntR family transcriptional regulator n=1 Tax=Streptomyces sp. NPDC088357 TaxID=3154655 RepID=UPI00342ECDB9
MTKPADLDRTDRSPPPGSALPAERTPTSRSQVSRCSVPEALRVLEHAGVLGIRTGSGTYVATEGVRASCSGAPRPPPSANTARSM